MKDGARSDDPAVQAQLDRVEALGHGGERDGQYLEPVETLLGALGHPERSLPPVFHVAGTNGKGSTIAFARAGLEAAGKRVHVFTSPHLVRFNERIRLGGTLIADAALAPLLEGVLDTVEAEGLSPSFFEATTAAAMLAFSRAPADALLLEVGMGGRLDATNVVARPAACGIAALGLDHQRWLGATLPEIAGEKAGIAKPGVPLAVQRQPPAALERIADVAAAVGARLLVQDRDWSIASVDAGLHYEGRRSLALPHPRLVGPHQLGNAGLALAMLDYQEALDLDWPSLAPMTRWADWPARLQRIEEGKLRARLPGDVALLLDGAHNREAALAVARALAGNRVHLVAGVLANRDPLALFSPFIGQMASFTALPVPGHDHHQPAALAAMIDGTDSAPAADLADALDRVAARALPGDTVLVMGSLYLAGAFLAANGTPPA
ncbi:bifunctional folylpolyglutamate synthase/dihydrofolate synthase [Sphingomicrobium astaxanthinifaciens]|uniref:bifunctional folylpolyglutamate synthase/dihydrofolate synthase n=1 Tax=Sphingomicrobium astaxanthinifaciens TaxID=1227949 RepID=UPI001FCC5081|nr:folylpolyglutamate synthase/dihydrofolate synthase family protein [Sphingomicrobium astaxanthinifaciens]MCJ7421860.1 bifunctional folylpolyglutamate synthase/dihydrofolate synthase [Sphingomicrobium astaxanthinifaciens]